MQRAFNTKTKKFVELKEEQVMVLRHLPATRAELVHLLPVIEERRISSVLQVLESKGQLTRVGRTYVPLTPPTIDRKREANKMCQNFKVRLATFMESGNNSFEDVAKFYNELASAAKLMQGVILWQAVAAEETETSE